ESPLSYRCNSELPPPKSLVLSHATKNNLNDVSVEFPLERFVCVTGVSGSGKTTLIREVLLPLLTARLGAQNSGIKASDRIDSDRNGDSDDPGEDGPSPLGSLEGWEPRGNVVLVDQSIFGKTLRTN